ncbi:13807_t:CDS:2 [Funneliformis mosseae]|uniref:13807_t:CDS:1 n=1 Tax=Funneliformis mosseae TaxID=27381 RepID=A0A9N9EZA8_FUNMO|nr:13807_t:CDS:2 [Funneliformis mosseae]
MEQSYYNRRRAFIESQIELIEHEFTPSEKWLSKAQNANDKIPLTIIDSQLQYLWDQKRKDALEGRVRVESRENFDDLKWIESFPKEWPQNSNCELDDEQFERYAQLRTRVHKIQEEYIAIKEKYNHYESLQSLVAPLNKSSIQQNIITKNAPVINEIKKMRVLAAEYFAEEIRKPAQK